MSELIVTPLRGQRLMPEGARFALAEWGDPGGTFDPPRYIAPLHRHRDEDEAWYVVEGRLRFRLGDEEVEAETGSAVFGPRGVNHTYWNPGPGPARYLVIMMPETVRMLEEMHSLPDRSPERMRDLFRRHGCELPG
ncbi:MAG TPA: cupin domain-containing protein [Candidatus Limnocylindrales bacterium]|nr:cupin domain-containing protein [Candidatus Limnocylindrales bacterium]